LQAINRIISKNIGYSANCQAIKRAIAGYQSATNKSFMLIMLIERSITMGGLGDGSLYMEWSENDIRRVVRDEIALRESVKLEQEFNEALLDLICKTGEEDCENCDWATCPKEERVENAAESLKRECDEKEKLLTNFDVWKRDLKLGKFFSNFGGVCSNCPAGEYCKDENEKCYLYCERTLIQWANAPYKGGDKE
jgi:hypothetical protein